MRLGENCRWVCYFGIHFYVLTKGNHPISMVAMAIKSMLLVPWKPEHPHSCHSNHSNQNISMPATVTRVSLWLPWWLRDSFDCHGNQKLTNPQNIFFLFFVTQFCNVRYENVHWLKCKQMSFCHLYQIEISKTMHRTIILTAEFSNSYSRTPITSWLSDKSPVAADMPM